MASRENEGIPANSRTRRVQGGAQGTRLTIGMWRAARHVDEDAAERIVVASFNRCARLLVGTRNHVVSAEDLAEEGLLVCKKKGILESAPADQLLDSLIGGVLRNVVANQWRHEGRRNPAREPDPADLTSKRTLDDFDRDEEVRWAMSQLSAQDQQILDAFKEAGRFRETAQILGRPMTSVHRDITRIIAFLRAVLGIGPFEDAR